MSHGVPVPRVHPARTATPVTADRLRYRPTTDLDGPALFRLFLQTHAAEIATLADDPGTRDALASMQYVELRMRARTEFPDAVDLVIENDDAVCGRVVTVLRADGIQLIQLAVLEEHRRHGIGSAALRRLVGVAGRQGCSIWLRADAASCDCRRFLERAGLTVTGRGGRLHVVPERNAAAA